MIVVMLWSLFLGTCFGSFINVVAYRVPRGESIIRPGSRCPFCTVPISWWDNIPVISWLNLRARCRSCGAPIAARYPLVELLGGFIAVACYLVWGLSLEGLAWMLILVLLLAIALVDLDTYMIPDAFTGLVGVLGLGKVFLAWELHTVFGHVGAGLAGAGLIWLIILVSKGGMGFGDVKLVGALGIVLGAQGLAVALCAGVILGAFAGISLLLAGRKRRRDPIPFGPFLVAGSVIAAFGGEQMARWYVMWASS